MVGLLEYCQHFHPVLPHGEMLKKWSGHELNSLEVTVVHINFNYGLILTNPKESGLVIAQPIVVPKFSGCLFIFYYLLFYEKIVQRFLDINVRKIQSKNGASFGIHKTLY